MSQTVEPRGEPALEATELELLVVELLYFWMDELEVGPWRIVYDVYSDRSRRPALSITPEIEYRQAHLDINVGRLRGLSAETLEEHVRHEVYHLAIAELVEVAESAVDGDDPFQDRALTVAVETVVTRLANRDHGTSAVPAPTPTAGR